MNPEKRDNKISQQTDQHNDNDRIPTAAEEGFTPQEEKELMEKCDRALKKFEQQFKQEDDSMDILQKP